MALKLVFVILTELLISKVTVSYVQQYSSNPYAIRDPRSSNPYINYASHAPTIAQPTYQRPAEVPAPVSRPVQYRRAGYPRNPGYVPQTQNPTELPAPVSRPVQYHRAGYPRNPGYVPQTHNPTELPAPVSRPVQYRRAGYPRNPGYVPQTQNPTELRSPVQITPLEYKTPRFPNKADLVSPIQTQNPMEYRIYPYQKPADNVTPKIQSVEYIQPTYQQLTEYIPQRQPTEFSPSYQNSAELLTPTIQTSLEYQPAYQNVADVITIQKPLELQQPCLTPELTSKFQSSQIPELTSSPLETLLTLSKSGSLPKSSSGSLDAGVLNNLAIALQLLIFNNILNQPRSESVNSFNNLSDCFLELAYPTELPVTNPFNVEFPCQMYDAKFLGSSNFGDDSIMTKNLLGLGSCGTGLPLSRPGFMSPYDAIAASSSSPFSESTPSLFTLKNNFQSPYASMLAADNIRDLFSMSDVF